MLGANLGLLLYGEVSVMTFPTDGHQVILNKMQVHKKSKTNRKRMNNAIRINHNRNTALEQSVINYCEA